MKDKEWFYIGFRMTIKKHDEFVNICKRKGLSMSSCIRQVLYDYIEKNK
ncbi:MAG: hypothetical protein ACOCV1_04630 [Bacillota bacterium]